MTISPNTTLAHYTIISKIGAGGMGEVYRARDEKLNRDVAIKVLPTAFARDEERLIRFKREAQVLASLNHTNIAAIYGFEDSNEILALVMELIEGPTLADRIAAAELTLEEALLIAKQIAEALEGAHERGIIHRDLKPANVKLTSEGIVKVLDFGLAKVFEREPQANDLSHSPTLLKGTQAGMILGTAAYMSPEQAKGKVVDKRADIWSFGCVLFEMLAGKQTFIGEGLTDTLAAVVRAEPDWNALPKSTPNSLRHLLRRCLSKDPKQRLRDIGDARIAIAEILQGTAAEPTENVTSLAKSHRLRTWLVTVGAVLLTAVLSILAIVKLAPRPADQSLRKFDIAIPQLNTGITTPPVISPDGRKFAYVAGQSLWVREFDSLTPREIVKGNSPQYFFWSPDSNYLAYMAGQQIWKVPVIGGQPSAVAAANFTCGAYTPGGLWTDDGRIVFTPSSIGSDLLVVSAEGGEFSKLVERESKTESDFHKPSALPQNRGILFIVDHFDGGPDEIDVFAGGVRKTVLKLRGAQLDSPVYSPTGHILYRREVGAPGIWALPFSLEKLEPTGESFLVSTQGSWPSVSSDGTMLFAPEEVGLRFQLVWVDRSGKVVGTMPDTDMQMWHPRISPDGNRIAFSGGTRGRGAIYILDMKRRTQSRLTLQDAQYDYPAWAPVGTQIYFDFGPGSTNDTIKVQPADGNSLARDVVTGFHPSLSRDGKYLFYESTKEGLGANLWYLPLQGTEPQQPVAFLEVPGHQRRPQPSPDGQFIAYDSNESGRNEIYIKDFPRGAEKWAVSTDGGMEPKWSSKEDRLFYINREDFLEVEITSRSPLTLGTPRRLFSSDTTHVGLGRGFDVSADGNRFLMVQQVESSAISPMLTVVENWFAEFKEKQKK